MILISSGEMDTLFKYESTRSANGKNVLQSQVFLFRFRRLFITVIQKSLGLIYNFEKLVWSFSAWSEEESDNHFKFKFLISPIPDASKHVVLKWDGSFQCWGDVHFPLFDSAYPLGKMLNIRYRGR